MDKVTLVQLTLREYNLHISATHTTKVFVKETMYFLLCSAEIGMGLLVY